MAAQNCRAPSRMKLTLACSSGAFGRSTILLLIVIVVIILIITPYIKPTPIQVVPKLLKITWKPNQLEPLCFLEGKASTSSMVLEKVEKSLCLSCLYLPAPLRRPGPLSRGNHPGHIFVPTCLEIVKKMKVEDCSLSGDVSLPSNLLIKISALFLCNKY